MVSQTFFKCTTCDTHVTLNPADDEELDGEGVIDPGMEYLPPPSMPSMRQKLRPTEHIKQEVESGGEEQAAGEDEEEEVTARRRAEDRTGDRKKAPQEKGGPPSCPSAPRYTPLSLYEERQLLRRLEACPQALAVTSQARRLHRKLLVRQAKRQRGLPLLDLDRAVSTSLSLVGGVCGPQEAGACVQAGPFCTSSRDLRILDRFQVSGGGLCCGRSRCGNTMPCLMCLMSPRVSPFRPAL